MSPETVNRPQPSTADFEICLGQRELTTKASEPCWKKLQFGLILSHFVLKKCWGDFFLWGFHISETRQHNCEDEIMAQTLHKEVAGAGSEMGTTESNLGRFAREMVRKWCVGCRLTQFSGCQIQHRQNTREYRIPVCIKSQQSWSNPVDAELDFKYVQSGANDGTFSTSECHLKKASKKQIDITGEWTLSSCHDGVPWTPAVPWGHSVLWAHQLQVLDDMDDMASLWNCFITFHNLDVSEPWWDSLRQSFWNK